MLKFQHALKVDFWEARRENRPIGPQDPRLFCTLPEALSKVLPPIDTYLLKIVDPRAS